MIRLELKNGEIAEIDLLERSIIYYRPEQAVTASKKPDIDSGKILAAIIEALGPGTDPNDPHSPVLRVKALVDFKAKVTEATGFLNAGHGDIRRFIETLRAQTAELLMFRQDIIDALNQEASPIHIADLIRRLKNDADHLHALARERTFERDAWAQNAKAATDGKVENPWQLDTYIDGLNKKLCDVANIVRDYVPPSRSGREKNG